MPYSINCLSKDYCVICGENDIYTYNGMELKHIGNSLTIDAYYPVEIQNENIIYAVWKYPDEDAGYFLMQYENKTWQDSMHFTSIENQFWDPRLFRIDHQHMAFSFNQGFGFGDQTFVLKDNGEMVVLGWYDFDNMSFAHGGGGLAFWRHDHQIYSIQGYNYEDIFYADPGKGFLTNFLVAADAE